jgi:hypothetical protein
VTIEFPEGAVEAIQAAHSDGPAAIRLCGRLSPVSRTRKLKLPRGLSRVAAYRAASRKVSKAGGRDFQFVDQQREREQSEGQGALL